MHLGCICNDNFHRGYNGTFQIETEHERIAHLDAIIPSPMVAFSLILLNLPRRVQITGEPDLSRPTFQFLDPVILHSSKWLKRHSPRRCTLRLPS